MSDILTFIWLIAIKIVYGGYIITLARPNVAWLTMHGKILVFEKEIK